MPQAVNMHRAKSSLSQLVKLAEAGEEILIARNGKPVARLTRIEVSKPQLPWGIFRGKMRMLENFDEPLEEMKDYV
jgi:prevent-host-death family protein